MFPGETILSGAEPEAMPFRVLRSAAGWYIGTADEKGPCTRESEYVATEEEAIEMLLDWSKVVGLIAASDWPEVVVPSLRRAYEAGMLVGART